MGTVDPPRDTAPALPADLEHGETPGPRPRLHYVAAGAGPPVLLLHGFPDFWYGWRHQIGPLVAAGYRVVAPDQRGYNRSDKPRAVRAYRLDALANDILRLADAVRRRIVRRTSPRPHPSECGREDRGRRARRSARLSRTQAAAATRRSKSPRRRRQTRDPTAR